MDYRHVMNYKEYSIHINNTGLFIAWPSGSNEAHEDALAIRWCESIKQIEARIDKRTAAVRSSKKLTVNIPFTAVIACPNDKPKYYQKALLFFTGIHRGNGKVQIKNAKNKPVDTKSIVYYINDKNVDAEQLNELLDAMNTGYVIRQKISACKRTLKVRERLITNWMHSYGRITPEDADRGLKIAAAELGYPISEETS